jgi:hypothetical protein
VRVSINCIQKNKLEGIKKKRVISMSFNKGVHCGNKKKIRMMGVAVTIAR